MSIPLEIPQSNTERDGLDRTGMERIALADGPTPAYRRDMISPAPAKARLTARLCGGLLAAVAANTGLIVTLIKLLP